MALQELPENVGYRMVICFRERACTRAFSNFFYLLCFLQADIICRLFDFVSYKRILSAVCLTLFFAGGYYPPSY